MSPPEVISAAPLIFVVDDETRAARRLAQMLTEDGFRVEALGDGREAIARFASPPIPDLIMTDVVMTRVGGIAVFADARRRWPDVPFLFVTGHPHLLTHSRPPFGAPPAVLTKPVSYAAIHAKIGELLGLPGKLISA